MASEELPADLDKLKITQTHPPIKSVERNPFYDADNGFDPCDNSEASSSSKPRSQHRWKCRPRRRSESCLQDCKQEDSFLPAESFEIVSPLSCSHGVQKHSQKRNYHAPHRAVQTVAPVQRISRNRNTALSAQLPGIAGWSDLWLPFNHVPGAIHHVLEIRS